MVLPLMKTSLALAALVGGASIAVAADAASGAARRIVDVDIDAIVADAREMANAARAEAIDRLMSELELKAGDNDLAASAFIAREVGAPREIVKNAPYTAEAVTETVRTLSDGNRIVNRTTTLLARDGYGRTRQERKGSHGNKVWLNDVIKQRIEPEKNAIVQALTPRPPSPPLPATASQPPAPPIPPAITEVTPGRIVVRRGGADGKSDDVRVEVIRVGREGEPGIAPPVPTLAFPSLPKRDGETKGLGMREFEGIKAQGTQTTYTIPAGEIGNERPIVIWSERWFSPELHIVVYAKTSDPRVGQTTYRLTNINRGEPPAELFRTPER
jgi:hypothetical protein